ncbi:oxidoreductase [Prochlorococcus sp. MIT 1300]|uniref:oxidoreductase n=1 Tax=Prochlorococcus sp. MIT 1300 TaxID=3096218 RepID=UPI002A74A6B0|nr:oxidoreductase [Prochlorococcus sp. MIT 1300]
MTWTFSDIPNQSGRIVLVTGANSGLGFETTRALLEKNATVIMCCRSLAKGELARNKLLQEFDSNNVYLKHLELSDLSSILKLKDEVNMQFGGLNLLINNAGLMAIPRTLTNCGLELQFAVNHIGHMALTLCCLPLLVPFYDSRVITVSSGAQYIGTVNWEDLHGENGYNRWKAYAQSKLANVIFGVELDYRLKQKDIGVKSLLAHPGLALTNLQPASLELSGSFFEKFAYDLTKPLFQSARNGSLPQLRAATSPNVTGGEQFGPRFSIRGFPVICPIAEFALKVENRVRFWEISKRILSDNGFTYDKSLGL